MVPSASTFVHIPARGSPDVFTLPIGWGDANLAELMRSGAYEPPVVARHEKKPLTYHGTHTFIHALLSHPFVIVYVQQNSASINYNFQYRGHIHVIGNVGIVIPAEVIRDIGVITELSDLVVRTELRMAVRYDNEVREEALRRLAAQRREEDIQAMMERLRSEKK
jgi:hypothetical protein